MRLRSVNLTKYHGGTLEIKKTKNPWPASTLYATYTIKLHS